MPDLSYSLRSIGRAARGLYPNSTVPGLRAARFGSAGSGRSACHAERLKGSRPGSTTRKTSALEIHPSKTCGRHATFLARFIQLKRCQTNFRASYRRATEEACDHRVWSRVAKYYNIHAHTGDPDTDHGHRLDGVETEIGRGEHVGTPQFHFTLLTARSCVLRCCSTNA